MDHFLSDDAKYYKLVCDPILWKLQYNGNQGHSQIAQERGAKLFHMALRSELRVEKIEDGPKKRQCYLCNSRRMCRYSANVPDDKGKTKTRSFGAKCVAFVHSAKKCAKAILDGVAVLATTDKAADLERCYKNYRIAIGYVESVKCKHGSDDSDSSSSFSADSESESSEDILVLAEKEESEEDVTNSIENYEDTYDSEEEEEETSNVDADQEPSLLDILLRQQEDDDSQSETSPELDLKDFYSHFTKAIQKALQVNLAKVTFFLNLDGEDCAYKVGLKEISFEWTSQTNIRNWVGRSSDFETASLRYIALHDAFMRFWHTLKTDSRFRDFKFVPKSESLPYINFAVTWSMME